MSKAKIKFHKKEKGDFLYYRVTQVEVSLHKTLPKSIDFSTNNSYNCETPSIIARKYGAALEDINRTNKIEDPDLINIGLEILIPEIDCSL